MDEEVTISSNIDWKALPREEAVKLAMKLFQFQKVDAEFYVSVAKGEIETDPEKQKGDKKIYY